MPWTSRSVLLNAQQRKQLKAVAQQDTASAEERVRALIILRLGEGLKNKAIAEQLGVHENTVVKWRGRWTGDNSNAHVHAYGQSGGRPRSALTAEKLQLIESTVAKKPPKGHRRWSVRLLAEAIGLPVATTQRGLVELQINLRG